MITRRQLTFGGLCGAVGCCLSPERASANQEFICATIERLPNENGFSIVDYAARGGVNQQQFDTTLKPFAFTDFGTSLFKDRWLRQDGLTPNHVEGLITLGIYFLDGSAPQREYFANSAQKWLDSEFGKRLRFDFSAQRSKSQIRVSFDGSEGNYSYVGRNNLRIPLSQKTMNITDVVEHVVLHEVGHALGLQHEHNHSQSGIVWNEQVVYADMRAVGWTDEMTKSNILTRYTQAANCIGSPAFDRKSVMLYPIPARWTQNGFSSGDNTRISDGDRQCLTGLYAL